MTSEKMEGAVLQKFRKMAESGQLVRAEEFWSSREPDSIYPSRGSHNPNLTRIWGTDFLRENLEEADMDAPENYLVVNDEATEIEITINYERAFPELTNIARTSGSVHAQKIAGRPVAHKLRGLVGHGFVDYKYDNILCDENGKNWVVDTESRSFLHPGTEKTEILFSEYLRERTNFLNRDRLDKWRHVFTISLAKIFS